MKAAVLNNDTELWKFTDLLQHLSIHTDLGIDESVDEWWGYDQELDRVWIALELPAKIRIYMEHDADNNYDVCYEWINKFGGSVTFRGYDLMMANLNMMLPDDE